MSLCLFSEQEVSLAPLETFMDVSAEARRAHFLQVSGQSHHRLALYGIVYVWYTNSTYFIE